MADGLVYRGMGVCEHNNDLIIAKKVKHNGASWNIKGTNNLGKLLALKVSRKLFKTLREVSKVTLPESITTEIVEVLSAAKVPSKEGHGHMFRNCNRPFTNASITNGRTAIKRIFDYKKLWELPIM